MAEVSRILSRRTKRLPKRMIEYLKQNRYGRATFLPLTAYEKQQEFLRARQALKEPGVIGLADTLVTGGESYRISVHQLLGRTVVVDHDRSCGGIARKYQYTLRIVTLEGESLKSGRFHDRWCFPKQQ